MSTGQFFRAAVRQLESFARREFYLTSTPKGSTTTNRKHLEQVKKTTGKEAPELDTGDPGPLFYLWPWYCELSRSSPLTFAELQAWGEMTNNHPSSFENEVLMRLDFINIQEDRKSK